MSFGKTILQQQIRGIHKRFFSGPLPRKLGIYFHELDVQHHDAIRELVSHFRSEGYRFTGNPSDLVLANDESVVFLSIDDNFQTTYDLLELADELAIRFAVYLNTMYFRDRDHDEARSSYLSNLCNDARYELLSQGEVREIASRGHTIGAHSHSHRQLSAMPQPEAELEIRRCKEELEQLVAQSVKHFSYPFGMRRHFTEPLREYCREIGFETVANAIPGLQHCEQTSFNLQRTGWILDQSLTRNIANLRIDGRLYERLTGRRAVV